jgi:hypothetical protein
MRKLLFLLLMAIALGCAQDNLATYMTYEMPNGRYWLIMDQQSKGAFVMGYEQAITFSQALSQATAVVTTSKPPQKDERLFVARRFYPIGVVRQETMRFLDQFFSAPENGRLLIAQGIYVFAMKMQGKSAAEIEGEVRIMRMSLP